ncbi:hypothetical protein F2Q70_00021597 [Brassica cretica]|uniref:Uncharacterized protein n=2 Tax=Brassica cretica TaxID=69181 RepID=A0A8S9GY56_BRACR|nr:hypothetical protein F2Q70_00021597 [Brassica cretica]
MIWLWYSGTSIEELTRMQGFGLCPFIDVRNGRYVATESAMDRSLRSDRVRDGPVPTLNQHGFTYPCHRIEIKQRATPGRERWILFSLVLLCTSNCYLILQFVSLIDGMISECGFKVSKLEVQIGELERDLGKTVSSLLKEKKARKTKSLEVRRLQRQIQSGEGSTSRGIKEAKDVLRVEFQTHLAKISDFLGSLKCIHSRDLALATIDGGMAAGGLTTVDGSFDLIMADLKSECFLPMCSEDPEGQDPVVGENGGVAAPSLDEAMGEGEV